LQDWSDVPIMMACHHTANRREVPRRDRTAELHTQGHKDKFLKNHDPSWNPQWISFRCPGLWAASIVAFAKRLNQLHINTANSSRR
jgi:hypothetical protein